MKDRSGAEFWKKVKVAGDDDCWLWQGNTNCTGHGSFHGKLDGRNFRIASRYSWHLHNGPIPMGPRGRTLSVCHKCDVPACVNPSHLFLGTQSDNLRDCRDKGRQGQWRSFKRHYLPH